METQNRGAQIYGYSVCLVAVITFLITTGNFVNFLFDLSDPLHSDMRRDGPSLASFENFKMDVLSSLRKDGAETSIAPGDEELSRMYEAAKAEVVRTVTLKAYKLLTVNGVLMIISVVLFVAHWRWMRKPNARTSGG